MNRPSDHLAATDDKGTFQVARNAGVDPRFAPPEGVTLQSILKTEDLMRRPARPRNHEAEEHALDVLNFHLDRWPSTILQRLVEVTLETLRAGSSGVSLISRESGDFYWPAVGGAWKPHLGGGTPRNFGPCGVVLDTGAGQLFNHPEKYYPYLVDASPAIEEVLLAPFSVNGQIVGTVWAVSHDPARQFDCEDLRLLTCLSDFAARAYPAFAS